MHACDINMHFLHYYDRNVYRKCAEDLKVAIELDELNGGGILNCTNSFSETIKRTHYNPLILNYKKDYVINLYVPETNNRNTRI